MITGLCTAPSATSGCAPGYKRASQNWSGYCSYGLTQTEYRRAPAVLKELLPVLGSRPVRMTRALLGAGRMGYWRLALLASSASIVAFSCLPNPLHFFLFVCSVFLEYICVLYVCVQCLWKPEEGVRYLRAGSVDACEPGARNSSPVQCRRNIHSLTTESSLWPHTLPLLTRLSIKSLLPERTINYRTWIKMVRFCLCCGGFFFLFWGLFNFMCLSVLPHVYLCTMYVSWAYRSQKRLSDPWKWLQMVVWAATCWEPN